MAKSPAHVAKARDFVAALELPDLIRPRGEALLGESVSLPGAVAVMSK